MTISIGVAALVFLIGLIILGIQGRLNEIFGGMFLAGLIALLLQFGHLRIG